MHWYTLTLSMQVPPLWHGLLSQSLMSEKGEEGAREVGGADASPLAARGGPGAYSRDSRFL